jgi:hypothetical protein
MTGSMAFFWRDIQTVKGACRAALALPHVDVGELRQVQASQAYTVAAEAPAMPAAPIARLTIKEARERQTKAWQANPPSLAELFALPILARVAV